MRYAFDDLIVTRKHRVLCASLVLAACSSDDEAPPGVEAIYGPPDQTELTPYPSNRYTVPADTKTGLRVSLPRGSPDLLMQPGGEITVAELEAMDGFSTTGGVIVSFTGPIDSTGLGRGPEGEPDSGEPRDALAYTDGNAPFVILDVDAASPERGKAVGLVTQVWEQPKDSYYTQDEYTLVARPATPLRPATRYLFALTDRVRARDGGPVRRSAATEALLAGGADGEEVRAALGELESALGIKRESVVLATTFTTASVTDGVIALGEAVRARALPTLTEPWAIETPLAGDGRVRFRAVYEAPEYRAADGEFEFDAAGAPVVQSLAGLEVFLAISDAATTEKRIPVIYGHGLGGDKDGCWGTADRLRDLNAAVFAIDSPHHGSRGDGDAALAIAHFFGVDFEANAFVIGQGRDNFRQMAADQLELVRLIGTLDTLDILPPGAPDGVPDLDTSRILYIGHSFGSVQGATVFALAPEITHAVWNVGGASLMLLLRDSSTFSTVVVGSLTPSGVHEGAVARFMTATQAIVDPGDPVNYARFAQLEPLPGVPGWSARDVLLQEVILDNIVPNSSTSALARAAGLPVMDAIRPVSGLDSVSGPLTANLASGATGAVSQFDTIEGGKSASHGELIFSPEGQAQYIEFFQSGLSNGHATIPKAYP
jgi:hypothetical protein